MAHLAHIASPPRRVSDDAREGIAKERRMSFASGYRMYPRAIAWSVIVSLTICMIAFDKVLVSGFLASPVFRERFGRAVGLNENGDPLFELSAQWQAALLNSATATECLGLLLNGLLTDRYGYKKVVIGSLVFMNMTAFLSFFAVNKEMLLAAQLLSGTRYQFTPRDILLIHGRLSLGHISDPFCNLRG